MSDVNDDRSTHAEVLIVYIPTNMHMVFRVFRDGIIFRSEPMRLLVHKKWRNDYGLMWIY